MTIRYDPIGTMKQTAIGRYITYAEHEALLQELFESLEHYFGQVQSGEMSAVDALTVAKVFVTVRS